MELTAPERDLRRLTESVLARLLPGSLHELGNRLTAVSLHLESGKLGLAPENPLRAQIELASADLGRAARFAALLQDVVRPSAQASITSAEELLDRVSQLLVPSLRRCQVRLHTEVAARTAFTAPLPHLSVLVIAAVLLRELPRPGGSLRLAVRADALAPGASRIDCHIEDADLPGDRAAPGDGAAEPLIRQLASQLGATWLGRPGQTQAPPAEWSIRFPPKENPTRAQASQ